MIKQGRRLTHPHGTSTICTPTSPNRPTHMTSPSGATITGVRQIALTVSDVAKATAFYRDALGLPFLFAAGPNLAFLNAGSVRLMLSTPEGDFKAGNGSMVYFVVADIQAAHAGMVDRGVTFIGTPHLIAKM